MRLLLIEDETDLSQLIARALERAGIAVDCAVDCDTAAAAWRTVRYDVAVVDRRLPDADGLDLVKERRAQGDRTPVLMLTARDAVADRIAGLNAGADDYMLKPFDMDELVARVKALLRRPRGVLGAILEAGNIALDTVNRSVEVAGAAVLLTRREMALLELLMRREGKVLAKSVIEDSLYSHDDEVSANSIEVAVHRLRRKLEDASATVSVQTVRGVGYFLA
ncbi:MAG: DNA-binding response regulator [Alphaproteobacteria bacterium]|nr:response regulator transcription factor [Alphaproteobacteria bacterium]TAD90193.1 MAG: DNA-binding response regulator [Alphaproteobacteria bacterium]